MKKGYYIHFQGRTSIGVSKKIDMQMEEFRKYFAMEEIDAADVPRNLKRRIFDLFPTRSIERNYQEVLSAIEKPDFIYIRRTVADNAYMSFLEQLRKRFPKCKIIVEVFTYPYLKDDYGRWDAWPFLLKELIYRKRYKRYVDRFVTYTNDEMILGVPSIRTINGIQVDKVKMVAGEKKDENINLLTVAYMQKHHGYERIIEGLFLYYQHGGNRKIILHLIGDGPEVKKYQEMVKRYKLEKSVFFYHTMIGDELDRAYDMADIALASFGMYKIGIDVCSALKTREYLAKGIPIATGCQIDILKQDEYPFVCQYSNDKEPVDVKKMLSFYDNIYSTMDRKCVVHTIREFAYKNVDNAVTMGPIIDYIAEGYSEL